MSMNIQELLSKYGDDRVGNWFLMSSPFSILSILSFYVISTKLILKPFMNNRDPLKLKSTLIVYNILKIVLNLGLFYFATKNGWLNNYSYYCQPLNRSNDEKAIFEISICWYVMFTKFLDLLDTVFIILRK